MQTSDPVPFTFDKPTAESKCGIGLQGGEDITSATANVSVSCPVGSKAGDSIQIMHEGQLYELRVPDGVAEGQQFQTQLSRATVPSASRAVPAVTVSSLNAEGLAKAAGLQVGDTVISINGENVKSATHGATLLKAAVGEVKILVTRQVPVASTAAATPVAAPEVAAEAAAKAAAGQAREEERVEVAVEAVAEETVPTPAPPAEELKKEVQEVGAEAVAPEVAAAAPEVAAEAAAAAQEVADVVQILPGVARALQAMMAQHAAQDTDDDLQI